MRRRRRSVGGALAAMTKQGGVDMTTLSGTGSGPQAPAIPLVSVLASAFSAGFAATIIFTLFMWYAGTVIAGFPMDVSQVVAAFLGDNPMLGTMAHYVIGTIAYPVVYVVIRGLLPGPPMLKGALLGI